MKYAVIGMNDLGTSLCVNINKKGHDVVAIALNKIELKKIDFDPSIQQENLEKFKFTKLRFMKKMDAVIVIIENNVSKKSIALITKLLSKIRTKKIFVHSKGQMNIDIMKILGINENIAHNADIERFILTSFHY